MSSNESEYTTTPTGMQSAEDSAELAWQPGYQRPEDAADPIKAAEGKVDHTYDPIGFAKWKKQRSDRNKEHAGLPEGE